MLVAEAHGNVKIGEMRESVPKTGREIQVGCQVIIVVVVIFVIGLSGYIVISGSITPAQGKTQSPKLLNKRCQRHHISIETSLYGRDSTPAGVALHQHYLEPDIYERKILGCTSLQGA